MTAPLDLREVLQKELGREITVEREIARGHYFAVFDGRQKNGRRVAIKVVPPQLATENPTRAGRVLRAARLSATIEHPHIVPVLRVAAGDRLAWFVTPFEPGSLQGLLEAECELPYARAVQLLTQVAAALEVAHQRRVLHGDLTPAVVMLDGSGAARVRDFGIAPAAEVRLKSPVAPYDPHYLAPERIEGASPAAASDQYALAVIAYQMLAGTRPFFGDTPDMVRRQHLQLPVPELRATRGDVPPAVAAAVERALAKQPEQRFPSVAAFAVALRGEAAPAQGRIPLIRDRQARTAGPAPRPAQGGLPPMPQLEPRDLVRPRVSPGTRPRGGRGGLQPAAAFAVVALGLAGLWLYVASTGPSDATMPVVSLEATATAPVTERSFGAVTPPEPAPEEETTASGADSAPREPVAKAPARRTPPARRPARATASREQRPAPEPPVAPPAPRTEDATTGFLTVGSVPQGAIFINGRLMPSNPVVAAPISAGPVRLRFEAADPNGRILEREMTINLGPGDSLNLGRVRLDRP